MDNNSPLQKKIPDQEVRWGIIGVGNVCEVKSAPAMQIVPNSRLVAVMRRDAAKAEDYAQRHGVNKWYDKAEDLIRDPEVNAIYIATPPNVHLDYTKMAAAAGKPVYVEKPMARTHAECLEMIKICEQAGVPLYVAYYRRALYLFESIKRELADQIIGKVRTVHISMRQVVVPELVAKMKNNWRVNPEIAGGGYFYDLASHQLDLLDFFFGPIVQASGFATNQAGKYPAEDMVAGSFVFENGIIGTGNWCFTASKNAEEDQVVIQGSKGTLKFQTFGSDQFHIERPDRVPLTHIVSLPKHIQQPMIRMVVGDLLGTEICPSTGVTAARTNRVMELISKRI